MPPTFRQHNAGFSLIEILLVIGVIAVLMVTVFAVYPLVRDKVRTRHAIENITYAAAAMRETFPSNRRTTSLYAGTIIQARAVPGSWVDHDWSGLTPATNEFNQPISLGLPARGYMVDGSMGQIAYYGIPASSCTQFVQAMLGSKLFGSIRLTPASGPRVWVINFGDSAPASMDTIIEACSRGPVLADMRWQ